MAGIGADFFLRSQEGLCSKELGLMYFTSSNVLVFAKGVRRQDMGS